MNALILVRGVERSVYEDCKGYGGGGAHRVVLCKQA